MMRASVKTIIGSVHKTQNNLCFPAGSYADYTKIVPNAHNENPIKKIIIKNNHLSIAYYTLQS